MWQGDWGTQFGMLIQYMAEKRPGGLNAATDEDVADLQVGRRRSICCFLPFVLPIVLAFGVVDRARGVRLGPPGTSHRSKSTGLLYPHETRACMRRLLHVGQCAASPAS